MRIPDGDLMPARRHKYRGSYGRSRRRHRRMALVLLVLVVVGATAWYLRRGDLPASGGTALPPCPTPSPTASPAPLPANRSVRLVLLNGTPRNGLAQQVGTQLRARGFVVVRQDNAPAAVAGASVVSYGAGAQPGALVLARNVLGAQVAPAATLRPGALQLVLGGDFRRLATPTEVAAQVAAAATAGGGRSVVPAPTATGTRAPCAA